MIIADIRRSDLGVGKLEPNWQGPYKVDEIIGPATYLLSEMNGRPLPRTWNALNLKNFYQ